MISNLLSQRWRLAQRLNLQQAIENLFSAKLRSLLAVLGILVGTASVVAMVSSGEMAAAKALEQFKTLGTDLLAVNIYSEKGNASGSSGTFGLPDIINLTTVLPSIKSVAPYNSVYTHIVYEGHSLSGTTIGATQALQDILKIKLQQGRFISFLDKQDYYCTIGYKLAEQMRELGAHNLLGKQLYLNNVIYTIIGIIEPWQENSFFNDNINSAVLIPIQTTVILSKYAIVNNIIMRIKENTDIDDLQQQLTHYIQQASPDMKLFFRSAKQLIEKMAEQSKTLTLLLGLIGSISLIVGGIGVMNIMLVSVIERRKEIGIRLAIGARRRDIQALFLMEAITLAFLGGILGIILGVVSSLIIAYFAKWTYHIFFLPVFIGFLVSVTTGIFFGFYPAYKASQLDPIEALRTD